MHGVRGRKKSKRMTLKVKFKIKKKVREHNKKLKKEMKKNPGKFKKKRDPGVPNSVPFKADIIREAQEVHAMEMEEQEKKRLELKMRRKEEKQKLVSSSISDFLQDAQKRGKEFELKKEFSSKMNKLTDKSAKAYYKELKKVVEAADVVLEVLDARDPQGTRCSPMEEMVKSCPNKRLVLVLNKADLVPKTCLEAWLKYLRGHHPTIIFKASTQHQSDKLSQMRMRKPKIEDMLPSSKCLGADVLMELLKNYCRNSGIKTAITVGVVGLPNVGKSSLINSLKRSRACNVGATPGVTKKLQPVILDSKVKLLDCPGVILPGENTSDASSSLRNALKIESLEDPITPVEAILERAGKEQMKLHYRLPDFKDTMEFLALFAKKRGKLGKNGLPRTDIAARMILQDWNIGKIKYYTVPPVDDPKNEVKSSLVDTMSKEFNFEQLCSSENSIFNSLPNIEHSEAVKVNSLQPLQTVLEEDEDEMEGQNSLKDQEMTSEEDDDDDDAMEEDEQNINSHKNILPDNVEIVPPETPAPAGVTNQKKPRWETERPYIDPATAMLKKVQKKNAKKRRKEIARNERKAEALAESFQSLGGLSNETYNFKDYFDLDT